MSVAVVNPETQYIMYRALSQHNIAEIPEWPGKDFEFAVKKTGKEEPSESELLEAEAAFALLGKFHCTTYTSISPANRDLYRFFQWHRSRILHCSAPSEARLEVHLEG